MPCGISEYIPTWDRQRMFKMTFQQYVKCGPNTTVEIRRKANILFQKKYFQKQKLNVSPIPNDCIRVRLRIFVEYVINV